MYHFETPQRQLVASLRPAIFPDEAGHHDRGLLGQRARGREHVGRKLGPHGDGLDDSGAVADQEKVEGAAAAQVIEPAANLDLFAGVLPDAFNRCGGHPVVTSPL